MEKRIQLPETKDGDTFNLAGYEFIKFPSLNNETPIVMRDYAFISRFGDNNDLRSSDVLRRMEEEILPKIIAAVGEENVCTFKTDLTTMDGLELYGVMESKISLPTIDFYRANGKIFNKYKPGRWCWLATPESAKPNDNPHWILCVSPSGFFGSNFFNFGFGVRPILFLKSSIFESFEN